MTTKSEKQRRRKNLGNADSTGWTKLSKYHWRRIYQGHKIDYWPSTKKFKVFSTGEVYIGDPMDFAEKHLSKVTAPKKGNMYVTIMSDASYCPYTKAAGWGVWVKSERGKFDAGGNYKIDPHSPMDAEAKAASIALFIAFKTGLAKQGDNLIVQSDCMGFIDAFNSGYSKKPQTRKAVKYIKELAMENDCFIEIRHVKAHNPHEGKRNWVNDLCDKIAKRYMRAMRKERNQELNNDRQDSGSVAPAAR